MDKIIVNSNQDGDEFNLYQIRVLEDNFSYLLCQDGVCLSIDPGESKPIKNVIEELDNHLEGILITHFHHDHTAGAVELKNNNKIPILGPKHQQMAFIDQVVIEGDDISLGPFSIQIIHSPGHTMEHIMYYFEELKLLFCGDVIFLGGCGKMFEGNENHYFSTIEKIKKLPKETRILTGHDYYKRNIEFIKSLDRGIADDDLLETDTFHTLEKELEINPFLQVKTPHKFKELYNLREEFRNKKA